MARVTFQLKEWNADKLLAKSERVLEQLGPIYAAEADRQVTTVKWTWPNKTVRRFGPVVGSPRDIVDSGTLLRSRQEPQVLNNTMTIKWEALYAMNVIQGKYGDYAETKKERNWIYATYQALPAAKTFAEKWRVTK